MEDWIKDYLKVYGIPEGECSNFEYDELVEFLEGIIGSYITLIRRWNNV